jgi:allantoicase
MTDLQPALPEFTALVDLASRRLGASVVAANDEAFAERQNLIEPGEPRHDPHAFGHKGKLYDGWETRRRREPGHDWAMVRLGAPGVVRGVVVDTAHFRGNYPPEISVEGAVLPGYPSPAELAEADWFELVARSAVGGDRKNAFAVDLERLVTHVRLCIYPDGGVARLRVHGEVVPDPRLMTFGVLDLAATENGGLIGECSNLFYSSPGNLILPGPPRSMAEGWETARRRDAGNDYVEFRLAGAGLVRIAELDTSYFIGNAPGWASLSGRDARTDGRWLPLLARQRLQPDTRHRFALADPPEVTHVRLDVFPDGGMARVRLWGEMSPSGRDAVLARWAGLLP